MASMNGTFTIEFCPEDRDRLDRLAKALETNAVIAPTAVDPQDALPGIVTEEVETTAAPEPEQPEQPKYTAAEIQLKVQKLAAPASGKRDAVRQIVKEYADRVSDIPEDKYAEVMDRLTALEEGNA